MNAVEIIKFLSEIYAITYVLDNIFETAKDIYILKENKIRHINAYNTIDKIPITIEKTQNNFYLNQITYPEELEEIINTFQKYIEPENFIICTQRLTNLKINNINILKDIKKYLKNFCNTEGSYNLKNNTINIYKTFSKKNVLSHEFLHMASTNHETSGFCTLLEETWIGDGLDEGYTELLNQRIFKTKKTSYTYNVEIVKLLELLFDNPKDMEYAYFHNNIFIVYQNFLKYGSKEEFFTIIQNLDNLIETDIPIYKNFIANKTKIILYEIIKKTNDQNKIKKANFLLNKDSIINLLNTKNNLLKIYKKNLSKKTK